MVVHLDGSQEPGPGSSPGRSKTLPNFNFLGFPRFGVLIRAPKMRKIYIVIIKFEDEDDHVYCSQCIEKHIESNVSELPLSADSDGIKCPQPGCDRKMLHGTQQNLAKKIIFSHFEANYWRSLFKKAR